MTQKERAEPKRPKGLNVQTSRAKSIYFETVGQQRQQRQEKGTGRRSKIGQAGRGKLEISGGFPLSLSCLTVLVIKASGRGAGERREAFQSQPLRPLYECEKS